jgi:cysteine desulfurase
VTGPRVYLDWNATAPLRAAAREAMLSAMDAVGNPSSVHAEGRAARKIVEQARVRVAALAGVEPDGIVFTSGATEAAALALPEAARLAVSGAEHDCLAARAEGGVLDVSRGGVVQATMRGVPLAEGLSQDAIGITAAQNETGVIQPVAEIVQAVRATGRNVRVICDAVQAVGRLPFDLAGTGADCALLSAHKLGGPKGVGALALAPGVEPGRPLAGGGQEQRRRGGTENVIGIAGFGAAAEAALREREEGVWARVEKFRNILESRLAEAVPETMFFGQESPRLGNTSCFAVPGWRGETQVMALDLAGFAVSAGSACSSGKVTPSRVIAAMGHDAEIARSAIRVSLGPATTEADVTAFAEAWAGLHARRRRVAAA